MSRIKNWREDAPDPNLSNVAALVVCASSQRQRLSELAGSELYIAPAELGIDDNTVYVRWLRRKAHAHLKRDRKPVPYPITGEEYRKAIHKAVCDNGAHDYYTGEKLDWQLVSTYDNAASKTGRSKYKAGFALLPTVDHVVGDADKYDFMICGWRTNNAKHDLPFSEFLAVCRRVVAKADAG